jgi:hypothetical protein
MFKNILSLIFTSCLLLFFGQQVHACSCSGTSTTEGAFSSEVVFLGKVVKIEIAKRARPSLLVQEFGLLVETPKWQMATSKIQIVTLEVIEPFKGVTEKTITLVTDFFDSCGVPYKIEEKYLVFADNRQQMQTNNEIKIPKENWTQEMSSKAEADKFNEQLPQFETNICGKTGELSYRKKEISEIRNFIKKGKWRQKKKIQPSRILY